MTRDFRLVTSARFLYAFAVQIQAVVMGWQVYEIARDPLYLGLIGLAEAAPALSLALFAGSFVDRSNPLRVYRNVIRLSLLSALVLVAVSWGILGESPTARLAWIYGAAIITGTARAFSGPSLYSLIPQLLDRSFWSISSAWITSAFQIASVSGPALGGILFAWRGARLPYLIDACMLIGASVSLALIRHRPSVPEAPVPLAGGATGESAWARLTAGVRFVFGHELLLSALALDMFAVLFGGAVALLPIFSGEILQAGPAGLGALRAAPAAGALIMSALLIRRPVTRHAGLILLWVVAGFGLATVGFALSRVLWLSMALLFISGALDSVSMVIRGAIVQLCSPDHMRGRVAAVNSMFIGSSNELGAFESGLAAKFMGTVPSVVFGGCMTLLTVAITARLAPKLRKMDVSKL